MANNLAIATVTATLARIIQAGIQSITSAAPKVTMLQPTAGSGVPECGVNLYLYQASPNTSYNNTDLTHRRPKGDLIRRNQIGIDLSYLFTFYGDEQRLEPQIFMASALRTLVDHPFLTSNMFRATAEDPQYDFLYGSTLSEQIERVRLTPLALNSSEAYQIWSQMPQATPALSIVYQAVVILLEGDVMGDVPMPIIDRRTYVGQSQPYLERVIQPSKNPYAAITMSSNLLILGRNLLSKDIRVRIGQAILSPQSARDQQISLSLSTFGNADLQAGVQSLQVLHIPPDSPVPDNRKFEPDFAIESNALAFILCPSIQGDIEVAVFPPAGGWIDTSNQEDPRKGEITLMVDVKVAPEQRALVTMNRMITPNQRNELISFVYRAKDRDTDTHKLVFPFENLASGEYLVRVQIDGADSEFQIDPQPESKTLGQFIGPKVFID
jgi:hypothetical protein